MNTTVTRIGVTSGMRGVFAVMYDDEGPIATSPVTCASYEEAAKDAIAWAKAEYGLRWKEHCTV